MIDLRPLASYLANEYKLDYEQMLDTLFDFFVLNKKYNGFFVNFGLDEKLDDVETYII